VPVPLFGMDRAKDTGYISGSTSGKKASDCFTYQERQKEAAGLKRPQRTAERFNDVQFFVFQNCSAKQQKTTRNSERGT
jgi:thiamine pyrophosphokinase